MRKDVASAHRVVAFQARANLNRARSGSPALSAYEGVDSWRRRPERDRFEGDDPASLGFDRLKRILTGPSDRAIGLKRR
jgi:hypothetical protein